MLFRVCLWGGQSKPALDIMGSNVEAIDRILNQWTWEYGNNSFLALASTLILPLSRTPFFIHYLSLIPLIFNYKSCFLYFYNSDTVWLSGKYRHGWVASSFRQVGYWPFDILRSLFVICLPRVSKVSYGALLVQSYWLNPNILICIPLNDLSCSIHDSHRQTMTIRDTLLIL